MSIFDKWKAGGLQIPKNKEATRNLKTIEATAPKLLYFPMDMHIGSPAKVEVEVGDRVQIGTLLGSRDKGISTNIHSSVSGKVVAIENRRVFRGESTCVVVENDFKDDADTLESIVEHLESEEFSERIQDAGITGKGGAGFPTAIKYNKEHKEVEYLVVNGSECEPYSTSDFRCMVEYSEEIVQIIRAISRIYVIDDTYIAVEDHMVEAIEQLQKAIDKTGTEHIRIHVLPSEYPQGHAGLQIREVLGIETMEGQRSGDIGVLQSNVSTIKAIYDAVYDNRPLVKRIITVTGPMIKEPKNLMVRIGTPVSHLLEECGGLLQGEVDMINGGPMMGRIFHNTDIPVDKDTTTLLFMEKQQEREETDCIRCARCIDNCPVDLQPILISNTYREGAYDKAPALRSESCISCGTCTFVCPANIPLLEDIQALNKKWKEMQS
ncbi:electron transport complex subunit RsxC [Gudongella sp. DL1XJH-153]|uniref:electron transport complex subunit RsxC n=1 Tax=Gudongella sp. DL1XJH-153 TaxID=3409804 RepID=UPI003BB73850